MVLGYELLASFKQEAEVVRGEIDVMMQDLIEKVESVQEDCQPEIYKDYKELKQNIAEQKDENMQLKKLLETVAKETNDQRERVEICSERILVMEEQVGMMAHNEAYKQSIEVPDELYQDSVMRSNVNQKALHTEAEIEDKEP